MNNLMYFGGGREKEREMADLGIISIWLQLKLICFIRLFGEVMLG